MVTRRRFLVQSAAIVSTATDVMCSSCTGTQASDEPLSGLAGKEVGPDTLDLATHAELAINGVLGCLDPKRDYEAAFLTILDTNPPYMLHWSTMVSGVMPKFIEALPMLRLMSGSDHMAGIEQGFLDTMMRNMDEDGLVYDRALDSRPWNVGVYYGRAEWNEDYANMAGNGRLLAGLLYFHQATGDGLWLARARRTAERMLELAVIEGDMAWYPNPGLGNDFSYPRKSGWTTRKPPQTANEGFEGGSMFYHFQPVRGFTRYYRATSDERFLELSGKFAKLGLQPQFWGGAAGWNAVASAERGHFRLHFHASMAAIRGVLDYAVLAGDQRAQQFAHDAYTFARQTGIHRLGLFPTHDEGTEGCSIADMIGVAVALTDAGLGDYWDDVESYVRNGLVCAQATDLAELQRVSAEGPQRPADSPDKKLAGHFDTRFAANNRGVLPGQEIHDRVLERSVGAFGHLIGARYLSPMMMHCCTANCSQALYFAWEGILRHEGSDSVVVNMWLNRRSPWVDVHSWQPYRGRLTIRNKGMRQITIRKPGWASRAHIRCQIDGRDATPKWTGNRLSFNSLSGRELIDVICPLPEEQSEYSLVNVGAPQTSAERYRIEFRGPTAISVDRTQSGTSQSDYYQGHKDHLWYRIFRRDHMRGPDPGMIAHPSYVHGDRVIRWTIS